MTDIALEPVRFMRAGLVLVLLGVMAAAAFLDFEMIKVEAYASDEYALTAFYAALAAALGVGVGFLTRKKIINGKSIFDNTLFEDFLTFSVFALTALVTFFIVQVARGPLEVPEGSFRITQDGTMLMPGELLERTPFELTSTLIVIPNGMTSESVVFTHKDTRVFVKVGVAWEPEGRAFQSLVLQVVQLMPSKDLYFFDVTFWKKMHLFAVGPVLEQAIPSLLAEGPYEHNALRMRLRALVPSDAHAYPVIKALDFQSVMLTRVQTVNP